MKKNSKQRLFEVMQRVDPSFSLNEGEGNEIDIKLDFPKNTSSINAEGRDLANNFPLTEEGLYNALYRIYADVNKRYYNLINVAYVNPRGRSGQYEMDIMLPDRQNQDYVAKDMKDNITELFIEINDDEPNGGGGAPAPGAEKQNFREGKKDNKERLFEVMQRVDETFKPKLNEDIDVKLVISEDISIDVEVGDTIMTGRFKNSPKVVKTIGKDEHGMPTINGIKVVTFRKATEKNK